MAPSRALLSESSEENSRSPKRLRRESEAGYARDDDCDILPSHPLNVRPEGNAYTEESRLNIRQNSGLFAHLPDELLLHFLDYLDAYQLIALGSTCKVLYAFAYFEELWRSLFVQKKVKEFNWLGTWRATYWQLPTRLQTRISCHGLYSDVLHRPFFCAHTSLKKYVNGIPPRNQISRMKDLTYDEFSLKWSDKPFILTQPVQEWPIYGEWTAEWLLKAYEHVIFRAESVDWSLNTYINYMKQNEDESPLYLFDRGFAEKMKLATGTNEESTSYMAPRCFGDDLFDLLGSQRPDSRWIIMGPARSGSTFHKDPNATSAWNAVLTGSKYWLMFPSGPDIPPPPGVILSEDASEITSPLSIAEYLLTFHEMARSTPGCREGICYAGEVLHVPSGWFHLVLNLEESIAITQNFVPRRKLSDVLRFLRDSPDQISGFNDDVEDPYALFVERLNDSFPKLLAEALLDIENTSKNRGTKWTRLINSSDNKDAVSHNGFSFGFGGDDYDDP